MYNVGDWLEFDYVTRKHRHETWFGEVREILHYPADTKRKGYLLMTQDGFRHFKAIRMSNVNLAKCPK